MRRILAVDWDRREVRCLLAATQGKRIKVIAAASAPLVSVVEKGTSSYADIGGSLRAALGEHRPGRVAALVGVDRASVEVMNFSLPPSTDAELAQLVANQATRESQAAADEAGLDFTPLDDDPHEPRQVTAAVLSSSERERIRQACSAAGFEPRRIVLRPFAAASLFSRMGASSAHVCLLVNLVADEADLTVVSDGRAVFTRTIRLPGVPSEAVAAERLCAEMRRTLLVAQQGSLGAKGIEQVFVYGGDGEHRLLADRIGQDLALTVTILDPFEALEPALSPDSEPGHAGRFASLVGMVLDEARGRAPAIDFLHPKRPPRPANRRRPAIMAGALVAAMVGAVWYQVWDESTQLQREYDEHAEEKKENDARLKEVGAQQELIEAVSAWEATDVDWLDELRELSLRFPSSRDAIIERMSLASGSGGEGKIDFQGLVRDPLVVARIEQGLMDQFHPQVRCNRVAAREKEAYGGSFGASISVVPREKQDYVPEQTDQP